MRQWSQIESHSGPHYFYICLQFLMCCKVIIIIFYILEEILTLVEIFVLSYLQTIFHSQFFMFYLHTKFQMLSSNCSLNVTATLQAKMIIHAAILLFYILQTKQIKSCIFFKDLARSLF